MSEISPSSALATEPNFRISDRLRSWLASRDWEMLRFICAIFVLSRALLVGTSLLTLRFAPPESPANVPWWQMWLHADVLHYVLIAHQGYTQAERGYSPAFFPLMPLAEHTISPLTGGDPYLAGILIANIAWLVALLLLYSFVKAEWGVAVARGTIIALCAFPTAFFTLVPYSESLFLALAIGSFMQMRQGHWGRAALLGLLTALTRQTGIVLVVPFLWEYATQHAITWETLRGARANASWFSQLKALIRQIRWDITLVFLIPLGTSLYSLWLWFAIGEPLAFITDEKNWHRFTTWPWLTIWNGFGNLFRQTDGFMVFRTAQELICVLAIGGLLIWAFRRLPPSYVGLAFIWYLLFLAHPTREWVLNSQTRYMLELFPVFVALGIGVAQRQRWAIAWVVLCIPLQLALMAIFAHGGWIT